MLSHPVLFIRSTYRYDIKRDSIVFTCVYSAIYNFTYMSNISEERSDKTCGRAGGQIL